MAQVGKTGTVRTKVGNPDRTVDECAIRMALSVVAHSIPRLRSQPGGCQTGLGTFHKIGLGQATRLTLVFRIEPTERRARRRFVMAARENTALQAWLIVTVMFAVGMAVMASVFYYRDSTRQAAFDNLKNERDKLESDSRSKNTEVQALIQMIQGPAERLPDTASALESTSDVKKMVEDFNVHMATYAANLDEGDQTYSKIGSHLIGELQNRNQQFKESTEEQNKTLAAQQANEQATKAQLAEAVKQQGVVSDELLAQKTQFAEYKRQQEQAGQALQARVQSAEAEKVTAETQVAEQKADSESTINRMQNAAELLRNRVRDLRGESIFRIPDGRVTWVNQRSKMVWINVGIADGLRRQMTFSVYKFDVNGIDATRKKAEIEVTRVLDEHLAEARITSDEGRLRVPQKFEKELFQKAKAEGLSIDASFNPIIPGDVIFSPVWRPGRRMGFALAGVMDVNGNDRRESHERDLVRRLITMNGGAILAEVDIKGAINGTMTPATTYLVKGAVPTDQAEFAGYNELFQQANEIGVQAINLDEFLSLMGYRGEMRTVRLDKASRGEDFQPKLKTGLRPQSTGQTSGIFRKRRPASAGSGGSNLPKRRKNGAFD